MTINFTQPVIFDAANNGYMVILDNGWPYEVLQSDPKSAYPGLWGKVQAWLAAGNKAQPYVPPVGKT